MSADISGSKGGLWTIKAGEDHNAEPTKTNPYMVKRLILITASILLISSGIDCQLHRPGTERA